MVETSSNNKQIAKNTLLLYLRMFLMMGLSLYTSRIVLNVLGVVDYGIYNVVGGVVSMLAFMNGALNTSTQRFLNFEMGRGNILGMHKIFVMSYWTFLLIAIIAVILAETIGLWFFYNKLTIPAERMDAAFWVYQLSIMTFIVSILQVADNAAIIAHEKMSIYAYLSILDVLMKLLLVIALKYLGYDKLILYSFFMFFTSSVITVYYRYVCKKKFEECKIELLWDKEIFKKLLGFSGWMTSGILCNLFSTQGVNILINMFFGPSLNAARGIAGQVLGAVNTFVTNFMTAVRPQIVKSYAQGDYKSMNKLVFGASKMAFFLLMVLSVPIMIKAEFILKMWLGIIPDYAPLFLRLVLFDLLITAMYNPLAYVNQATGKIGLYQLMISISFLCIFIFSYMAFKMGKSVETTFYISICIDIIGLFIRLLIMKKQTNFPVLPYLCDVALRGMTIFIVIYVFAYFIDIKLTFSPLIQLVVVTGICEILSLIGIWILGLNSSEKKVVILLIKNKLKK